MDLRLFASVVWRFRLLVATGFILAVVLATLTVVKVGPNGLTYRDSRLWSAEMQLKVTQAGCPECRLYATTSSTTPGETGKPIEPKAPIVDPVRFASLALDYAVTLTTDPVRRLAAGDDGITGKLIATALRDPQSGTLLPYIDVTSISTSAQGAVKYAHRSAAALNTYILAQQRANHVPESDRAIVVTVIDPHGANVYRPRPKTMPLVVFFAVMFATIGLAFVLENTRPRKREEDSEQGPEIRQASARRSA
jgi:hypothetical protein